eukprot:400839-Hanusia_phi.AAC.1
MEHHEVLDAPRCLSSQRKERGWLDFVPWLEMTVVLQLPPPQMTREEKFVMAVTMLELALGL